jgi:hypothetical protein
MRGATGDASCGPTALSAAVAAVALGILAVLPGGGSSVVGPAAAALEVSDNTILHVEMRGEHHNLDGSVVTWQSESWQLSEAPFTRRQIEVGSDGIRAESLTRDDAYELFDAERNTIYTPLSRSSWPLTRCPRSKSSRRLGCAS